MKIIECPRDAMQGIEKFIPTETKIHYINKLLKIGFDTIDFGSFVSEKAVPQMRDTSKVIDALDLNETKSKLLSIIANSRGANKACEYDKIEYLGYPLSISNEFQLRNTGMTCVEALKEVSRIKEIAEKKDKNLVVSLLKSVSNDYSNLANLFLARASLLGDYKNQSLKEFSSYYMRTRRNPTTLKTWRPTLAYALLNYDLPNKQYYIDNLSLIHI